MNLVKARETGGAIVFFSFEALLVFLAEIAKINKLFITTLKLIYPAAVVLKSYYG